MKPAPGTYALILQSHATARIQIGRWREIDIEPGYYIYIGSAFGPGDVRARFSRHFRANKPNHWHIDYLSEYVTPLAAWVNYEPEKFEHQWAHALFEMSGLSSIQGFGCSDCRCYSHIFHTTAPPAISRFANIVGNEVEVWLSRHCSGLSE